MNVLKRVMVISMAFGLTACGDSESTPVREFLAVLSEPDVTPARLNGAFVSSLDAASRARVAARAAALGASLGVKVLDAEVVRVEGLTPGLRVSDVKVHEGRDGVTIAFANTDPNAKLMAPPVDLRVVVEDDTLHFTLPDGALGETVAPAGVAR